MNNDENFLWTERYRPITLSDCILPKRLYDEFAGLIEKKEILNMLFSGSSGIGKTTVARVLAHDLDMDCLVINCSLNGNIDTLRTKIQDFVVMRSLMGKSKMVLMDEADHLTPATMASLRNFIETHSKNCRFIFTANYKARITAPLHSRFTEINFDLTAEETKEVGATFLKRLLVILEENGVEHNVKSVAQLVRKWRPDFRKIINELQGLTINGALHEKDINNTTGSFLGMLATSISTKQFTSARGIIASNQHVNFQHFLRVKEYLIPLLQPASIPDMFLILNDYDTKSAFATDPEVHLTAMIVELTWELEYK